MKIKRLLSICAISIFATALLVGCSSDSTENTSTDTTATDTASSSDSNTNDSTDTKDDSNDDKEDGKSTSSIAIPWDEVSDEYEDAAVEAKEEIVNASSISVDTLKSMTSTIRKDYKIIKDGVTKSNKDSAKEMFITGEKIEALAERASGISEEEFIKLGINAKNFVKALHGGGSVSLTDANYDLDTSLNVTKKLGNDKWKALAKKVNG